MAWNGCAPDAFRWDSAGAVHEAWDTRRYEVSQLESVSYVLTPFSQDWRGPAHAFLSFGFRDGRYLTVSVEARREQGETYSMLRTCGGFDTIWRSPDGRSQRCFATRGCGGCRQPGRPRS